MVFFARFFIFRSPDAIFSHIEVTIKPVFIFRQINFYRYDILFHELRDKNINYFTSQELKSKSKYLEMSLDLVNKIQSI